VVELAVLAVVNFERDDGSCLEGDNPKLHVGDAAAHKEVDLAFGVLLLGGKPTRQLELIVFLGSSGPAVAALLEGGLDLNAEESSPCFSGQQVEVRSGCQRRSYNPATSH